MVAVTTTTSQEHMAQLAQIELTPEALAPPELEPVPVGVMADASPSPDAADDDHAAETVVAVVGVSLKLPRRRRMMLSPP